MCNTLSSHYPVFAFAIALTIGGRLQAQSQEDMKTQSNAQFEVASLKEVAGEVPAHNVSLNIAHDRATVDAATLRQLIGLAYNFQRMRIVGGDTWLDATRYDVVAKTGGPDTAREQVREMLRQLLKERFGLEVHRDVREIPVFVMTVSKRGAKLKPAPTDETPQFSAVVTPSHEWLLTYKNRGVTPFVNAIANFLSTPVQDETGLTGLYDFALSWSAITFVSDIGGADSEFAGRSNAIAAAMEQQLGLRLEPKKRPLEVLIVDHAAKASEN